jgi:hypothetical protein
MLKYYLSDFRIASGISSLRLKPDLDTEFISFGEITNVKSDRLAKN